MDERSLEEQTRQAFAEALALHRGGTPEAAEAAYRRVLQRTPDHADALNNLALLLKQRGDFDGAEEAYHESLIARPQVPEVLSNLGVLLLERGRLAESETALREALRLRPDYPEAWNNLGNLMQGLRRHEEAIQAYLRILQRPVAQGADRLERATRVEAAWNLSLLLLLQGRYAEAWPLHEARYHADRLRPVLLPPPLPMPMWRGEALAGKAILVWFEQGMGDELHFARYASWLKAQGARRVTWVCKAPLVPVLQTVPGIDEVFPAEGQLVMPPQDYWVFAMSLALHHRTTLESVPAALPYVHALPARIPVWAERLPKRGKRTPYVIGLAWAGSAAHRNDAQRSVPALSVLRDFSTVDGVAWVSLQKGEREEEAKNPPAGWSVLPLGARIQDFGDTAAIIHQLDLVITVDTAIAHLAAAMGKPCWVMLPWLGTDWRWQQDGASSPWYPGVVRLFRQPAAGDWGSVVAEVVRALKRQHKQDAQRQKAVKSGKGKRK